MTVAIDPTSSLARPKPIDTSDTSQQSDVGRDAFMKLLVAQMRNQDPLDPMDSREMISQLSQLTGVEQLVSIQKRIGALEIATAGMANTQVASLVGSQITANLDSFHLPVTGPANSVYSLDARASEVTITIRSASGQAVRTMQMGDTFPGTHAIIWDGMDETGQRLPQGRYTVEITATSAAGTPVTTSTEITGRATGVTYENGYPELIVGEARVMLGDVVSITE